MLFVYLPIVKVYFSGPFPLTFRAACATRCATRFAFRFFLGEPREGGRERGEVCRSKEGARFASHCKTSDQWSEAVFDARGAGGRSSEGGSVAGSRKAHDRANKRAGAVAKRRHEPDTNHGSRYCSSAEDAGSPWGQMGREEAEGCRFCLSFLRGVGHVTVAAWTGLRKGNVLNLKRSQVNIFNRTISLDGLETKNGEHLIIPVAAPALEAIKDAMKVTHLNSRLCFAQRTASHSTPWKCSGHSRMHSRNGDRGLPVP